MSHYVGRSHPSDAQSGLIARRYHDALVLRQRHVMSVVEHDHEADSFRQLGDIFIELNYHFELQSWE